MKATFRTLALGLLILLTAAIPSRAFSLLDPQSWPPSLNPHNWPFTLIPVPEITTDPNGGVTVGVLFATLFKDDQNQISSILAPDINYNNDLGPGGAVRYLAYPSEDTQWYAIAGAQENIERLVDVSYATGRTHKQWWSLNGRLFFERDPTERFFGIGNNSSVGPASGPRPPAIFRPVGGKSVNSTQMMGESNYTTEQVFVSGALGWNVTEQFQLSLVSRPRYVRILRGAFSTIPQTTTVYPHVKGVGGGSEVYDEIRATFDNRDSLEIPRHGGLAILYYGNADRRFMSSVSYNRFGGELRHYWTFGSRVTVAAHTYLQYMPAGNEAPFWSMGRLGGDESILYDQETLRGYGAGRFIDNNLFVGNVEVRTRVFEADLFGTHGIAELAPFFEAGRVFHRMTQDPLSNLHPVGGLGLRAIAEPFVVGYLDVGMGGDGAAVFSGIDYPF